MRRFQALFASCLALAALFCTASASAQSFTPVEGKDYDVIDGNNAPFKPAAPGKVVVEEFFNYICPACSSFEPTFATWQKTQKPDYVEVHLIPASFRQDFDFYAHVYYAAKDLGIEEQSHDAVFAAIHGTKTLPGEGQTLDADKVAAFYAKYGVTAEAFKEKMQGFTTDVQVRKATQYMKACKIMSTPTIVVAGKYRVKGTSYEQILQTVDYLAAKEHAGQ